MKETSFFFNSNLFCLTGGIGNIIYDLGYICPRVPVKN